MAQPPGAENGPTLRRLSRPAAKITLFGSGYAGLGFYANQPREDALGQERRGGVSCMPINRPCQGSGFLKKI